MNHVPIKMGPLALLLAVISVCMTTLGILTFATAEADLRLAEKYRSTVVEQYERESIGQEFLSQAGKAIRENGSLQSVPDAEVSGNKAEKSIEIGTGKLVVKIEQKDNGFNVKSWRTAPVWEAENNNGGFWVPGS